MKIYHFKRISHDGNNIFGSIFHEARPTNIHFLENYKLRVKTGEYIARRDEEGKYIGYWELQNVEGRTEIIAGHIANVYEQLEGCFALGKRYGKVYGKWKGLFGILDSMIAVTEWHKMTKNETEIKIIVEEAEGWVI